MTPASGDTLEGMDDERANNEGTDMGASSNTAHVDSVSQPTPVPFPVLSRVVVARKYRATVRYVGPVDGQDGCWVGLEWDDPERGKHDGTHNGKRYFVSSVPGAASLVRLASLMRHGTSPGISLKEAVASKYMNLKPTRRASDPGEASMTDSEVVPSTGLGPHILASTGHQERRLITDTVVREDVERISQFLSEDGALEVAGLASLSISSVCDRLAFLKNVKEIDLSDNLLSERSWGDVLKLADSIDSLKVLNLSYNRMGDMPPRDEHCRQYRNTGITTLALNGCMIQEPETILRVGSAFPNLKELYMFNNRMGLRMANGSLEVSSRELTTEATDLQITADAIQALGSLEVLDLGQNDIVAWTALERLIGGLPRLRVLLLEGNGLDELAMSRCGQFASLVHLNISRNRVMDWDKGLQNLEYLSRLEELRFSDNPVCSQAPDLDRLIAIGRISKLKWINGSEITAAERRDSELAFLRSLNRYVPTVSGPVEERIAALERLYGVVRNASLLNSTKIGATLDLVELTLVWDQRVLLRQIPSSLTIHKLSKLTDKLLARHRGVASVGDTDNNDADEGGIEVILGGVRFEVAELFGERTKWLTVREVITDRSEFFS